MTKTKHELSEDCRMPLSSADVLGDRIEALRKLFPEAFAEGKVDLQALRVALGQHVDDGRERYGLSWAGKAEAMRAIQVPSVGTLIPVPEESVNFETSGNVFIEGDNLEVLKLLQKSYYGKVKLIYIDPPYNTGNEFIYPDNFREGLQDYLKYSGQVDAEGLKLSTNTETNGRFHSKWLNMMWPRIFLARNLLRPDGILFVSVDDNELANLLSLLGEIFGEENQVGVICWRNVTDNNPTLINKDNEFILCFARDKPRLPQAWKSLLSEAKGLLQREYDRLAAERRSPEVIEKAVRQFIADNVELIGTLSRYKHVDEHGIYTGSESVHNPRAGGYDFEVLHAITKKPMRKPANGYRFPEDTFRAMERKGKILYGEDENRIVKIKKYLAEHEDTLRSVITMDGRLGSYDLKRVFGSRDNVFPNPKPVDLLLYLLSFSVEKDDLVLDFFAGSGTTAEALLRLNARDGGQRRFILAQLPERIEEGTAAKQIGFSSIADIAKERIRRVIKEIEATVNPQAGLFEARSTAPQVGVRVFKLTSSNFKIWDGDATPKDPEKLMEQIRLFADHIIPGRSQDAILHELILKAGLPLTAASETKSVQGAKVYSIANGLLLVCLEDPLKKEVLRGMVDLKPQRVLCLDHAFRGNDKDKVNALLEMRSHGVEFRTV